MKLERDRVEETGAARRKIGGDTGAASCATTREGHDISCPYAATAVEKCGGAPPALRQRWRRSRLKGTGTQKARKSPLQKKSGIIVARRVQGTAAWRPGRDLHFLRRRPTMKLIQAFARKPLRFSSFQFCFFRYAVSHCAFTEVRVERGSSFVFRVSSLRFQHD